MSSALLAVSFLFLSTASIFAQGSFAINVRYDPNVPPEAQAAFGNVVSTYQSLFTNPITVNIHVVFGQTGLGASSSSNCVVAYSDWLTAMAANAATHGDNMFNVQGVRSLPAVDPIGAGDVVIRTANARALGFNGPGCQSTSDSPDSTLTFTNAPGMFEYSGKPTLNLYDFGDVAAHELNEALGIASALTALGNNVPIPLDYFRAEDYFRYGTTGSRMITTDPNARVYFSFDGGRSLWAQFNQVAGADRNDWASNCLFIQDSTGCPDAVVATGTSAEITVLETLGYNPLPLSSFAEGLFLPMAFGS